MMMLYVLLLLTLGSVLHGKHVDVYGREYSVTKTVEKRQVIHAEAIPKPVEDVAKEDGTAGGKADGSARSESDTGRRNVTAAAAEEVQKSELQPGSVPQSRPAHDGAPPRGKEEREHSGALLRSLYVFLGLSVLVMGYLGFRAFRVRPGAPAPTTVRKYGVVGRRSDMEMLPLPLNEEEDDDTLFEVHQTSLGQQTR